jgi:hypothetical protein
MFSVTVFTTLSFDDFLQFEPNHCPFTHAMTIMAPQQAPGGPEPRAVTTGAADDHVRYRR